MTTRWARARGGFLWGASLATLIGVMIAGRGAINGEVAEISLGLGGMGLSVTAAFVAVDRVAPCLGRHERWYLGLALLLGAMAYVGLMVLAVPSQSRVLLTLAGIVPTATGAWSISVALQRKE